MIGTICQNTNPKVPDIAFSTYFAGVSIDPRNRTQISYIIIEQLDIQKFHGALRKDTSMNWMTFSR